MIDGVELLIIPVIVMNHSRLRIVWNQDTAHTSEVLIHMDMSSDPGMLLLIGKGFDIRVLAICQNTCKEESRNNLSGVRICDLSRISGPVDFDLFAVALRSMCIVALRFSSSFWMDVEAEL